MMPARSTVLASFFSIEAKDYTHFTFDAEAAASARNIVIACALGILLAVLAAFYHKNVPGAIVRSILRAEAFSPESAKTPEELSLAKNFLYAYELRHNVTLKKLIVAVTSTETPAEGEEETPVIRYYIPEEKKYNAEVRFEKKGSGPIGLLVSVALVAVFAIVVMRLIPVVLSIIDNFIK